MSSNAQSTNGLYLGGTLNIPSNSIATLKALIGPYATILITTHGTSVSLNNNLPLNGSPVVIAGPGTIQIQQPANYSPGAFATFDVEPGPFPPGKAVTVGAYSGNVQVTMQMSTDLVNWTTATNGAVYTNSPDARFFRIQLVTNASP